MSTAGTETGQTAGAAPRRLPDGMAAAGPPHHKWSIFLLVATGVFMSTLDSSMVNIALPAIMSDFHSTLPATEWIVLIYLLTITASLLFWGHLADRSGRRRIYASGMLIFGAGSLLCALSPSLTLLITSRFGQALGAAMMMATGPAVIKETFPKSELGKALGLIGVAVSLGLMSGPAVGGLLLEYASWRSLFYLTVPIGLLAAALSVRILPSHQGPKPEGRIDYPGAVLMALGLSLVVLVLTHTTSPERHGGLSLIMGLGATSSLLAFFKVERRAVHPLLPPSLLRQRYLGMGILSAVLSFATLFSAIMLIPFYLDRVRGLPPSKMGMVMVSIPAAIMVSAPVAGWLSDRIERRLIATSGLLTASTAMLSLAAITSESSLPSIAARLALMGCGQAMFLAPNSAAVLAVSNPGETGTAASLLAAARNLGMLIGIALSGLVFNLVFSRITGGLDMRDFRPQFSGQFMTALRAAFGAATLTGYAGMAASWLRGGVIRRPAAGSEISPPEPAIRS